MFSHQLANSQNSIFLFQNSIFCIFLEKIHILRINELCLKTTSIRKYLPLNEILRCDSFFFELSYNVIITLGGIVLARTQIINGTFKKSKIMHRQNKERKREEEI